MGIFTESEPMRRISAGIVVPRVNDKGKVEVLLQLKCRYNHWEFPGGKLDGVETAEECARRELREETGIKAIKLTQLCYIDHRGKFGCVMFLANKWKGTPKLKEPDKQSAMGWFELDTLPTPLLTQDTKASLAVVSKVICSLEVKADGEIGEGRVKFSAPRSGSYGV